MKAGPAREGEAAPKTRRARTLAVRDVGALDGAAPRNARARPARAPSARKRAAAEREREDQEAVGVERAEAAVGVALEEVAIGVAREEAAVGVERDDSAGGVARAEVAVGVARAEAAVGVALEEAAVGVARDDSAWVEPNHEILGDGALALAALEASGARGFDAISCDCVRALIARADALPPSASGLLHARARVHIGRLAARFERARGEVERRIVAAEQVRGALLTARAALARGELSSARRMLRQLERRPPDAANALALAHSERLRRAGEYETALAEIFAVLALARAVDGVPEQAGPYNPLRIASDLLERIRAVSPLYLTAQLQRLEELAGLLSLPEFPEPISKPPARKARGTSKRQMP
jgi:hypothetical protein